MRSRSSDGCRTGRSGGASYYLDWLQVKSEGWNWCRSQAFHLDEFISPRHWKPRRSASRLRLSSAPPDICSTWWLRTRGKPLRSIATRRTGGLVSGVQHAFVYALTVAGRPRRKRCTCSEEANKKRRRPHLAGVVPSHAREHGKPAFRRGGAGRQGARVHSRAAPRWIDRAATQVVNSTRSGCWSTWKSSSRHAERAVETAEGDRGALPPRPRLRHRPDAA